MTALQQLVERNCRPAELLALASNNRTARHYTLGTRRKTNGPPPSRSVSGSPDAKRELTSRSSGPRGTRECRLLTQVRVSVAAPREVLRIGA